MLGKVILYSKDGCPYCDKAKELVKRMSIEYIVYRLDKDFTRDTIKAIFPQAKTYPVITVDGLWIGGYTELASLIEKEIKSENRNRL